MVHFVFWTSRWDEWISRASPRLAPAQSRICKQASNQASELNVTYLCATLLCCVLLVCVPLTPDVPGGPVRPGQRVDIFDRHPNIQKWTEGNIVRVMPGKAVIHFHVQHSTDHQPRHHTVAHNTCLPACVCALFLQGYGSKFDETHDVPFNPDLIQPYGAHTKKKRGYRYCTASFLLSPTLSNTLSLSHTLLPRPKASEAWANKKRERVVKRETDHWVYTSTMPTLSSPRLL